jgi:transporter family-2 protein
MGSRVGLAQSTFIIYLGGTITTGLVLLFLRENFKNLNQLPRYTLFTGVIGVAIISIMSYAVPNLGVGSTTALSIVGQLIMGLVADHFGLFGVKTRLFEINRFLGLLLLLSGAWLVLQN